MRNNSTLVWWIPTIILLMILLPLQGAARNIYLNFGMIAVGFFALWFVLSYLFFFKERKNAKVWGWIFLVVALFYNPLIAEYNAAIIVANKSHLIAILMNLVTCVIFLYNWWLFKFKEKSL